MPKSASSRRAGRPRRLRDDFLIHADRDGYWVECFPCGKQSRRSPSRAVIEALIPGHVCEFP